jgi:hypothetical protein
MMASPRAFARGRFSRYKDEDRKCTRLPDMLEDKPVERMADAFMSLKASYKESYLEASEASRALSYSPDDLARFCLTLRDLEERCLDQRCLAHGPGDHGFALRAGNFLSALANNGPGDTYALELGHLDSLLEQLGAFNTKTLIVNGDLGSQLGFRMGWAGQGGRIIAIGHAGDSVGWEMVSGQIHIEGGYGSVIRPLGGRIYFRGKLFVDKPETGRIG